jgi:peptidoglycan/LPS O-acetylase OafA/YrhL
MSTTATHRRRLDFIDVARGVAAMIVLLEHALHGVFPAYKQFSEAHFMVGEAAILTFFMISGFVIPMSLEEGRSVATFWKRRCFRLLPVYWLSLVTAWLCFPLGLPGPTNVPPNDWMSWLANAFLLQERLDRPAVLGVYWSLHYELNLYIAFSVLALSGILGRIGVWTFVAVLIARALPISSLTRGTPAVVTYNQAILLAAAFGFIAYRYVAGKMSRAGFYTLAAGVLGVVLFRWTFNRFYFPTSESAAGLLRWTATLGLAGGAFILLLETPPHRLPRVGCWLGRRSYPIYLLHPMAGGFIWVQNWHPVPFLFGAIALTLLFAEMAHRFVERPAIALGRRLEARPARETTELDARPLKRAA